MSLAFSNEPVRQRTVAANVLPTNLTTWRHPVHRWYNFIAGYSPEFVENCLINAELRSSEIVLDPFAGCGTTLVVAKAHGHRAAGYEPHPFFRKIAVAKTQSNIDIHRVAAIGDVISSGLRYVAPKNTISPDARVFLEKLFAPEVLSALLGVRAKLAKSTHADDPMAFLMASRLLDECSFSQTDGIYKAPTSRKRAIPPETAIARIVNDICSDLTPTSVGTSAVVYGNSAESMSELSRDSVSLIVTSPPYLNNFDFAEMTRMQLYYWGMADNWGDITDRVRSLLVTNTTTALKGHRHDQDKLNKAICPSILPEIDQASVELAATKRLKAGKKDYDLLLRPYMAQITEVYRECLRVLRPGGISHTMIADAAFYGVHIPSPQWLATSLEHIGFTEVSCHFVRKRGHRWKLDKRLGSPIGLGEYHIVARKKPA